MGGERAEVGDLVILVGVDDNGVRRQVWVSPEGKLYVQVASALVAGENHIGEVGGRIRMASARLQRPNNTTQYAANDQVAQTTPAVLAFEVGRIAGGSGLILDAVCIDVANQATKAQLELVLFNGPAGPVPNADNAPWAIPDSALARCIGSISFTTWSVGNANVGEPGNCFSHARNLTTGFRCDPTTTYLWGQVVERGTYTPVANETFDFWLKVSQD